MQKKARENRMPAGLRRRVLLTSIAASKMENKSVQIPTPERKPSFPTMRNTAPNRKKMPRQQLLQLVEPVVYLIHITGGVGADRSAVGLKEKDLA